jgi:hypothetical protein
MKHAMASRSPSGKLPQSDRKSFFKCLAADIKGRRDAIRAEDAANPFMIRNCSIEPLGDFNANLVAASPSHFEEPSPGIPRKKSDPCAGSSLGHSTDDFTDSSCDGLLTRAEKWNLRVMASSDDDIPLRARLLNQQSNTSTTVIARVEWKNDTQRYFVIRTGTQELLAFPLSVMKIERVWSANTLERTVAISIPYCDSDGFHAVSLMLDSRDCLERLSRMTALDILG